MSSEINEQPLDSSVIGLNDTPERLIRRPVKLPKLKTEESERYEGVMSPEKRRGKNKIPKGYEIADMDNAILYWY